MINRPLKRTVRVEPLQLPSGKRIGIWNWNAGEIKGERLLNVIKQTKIREIYTTFDESAATRDEWRAFIRQATDLDIEVHALAGDPSWALPGNTAGGLQFIQGVRDYNAAVDPLERFDAIQLDVEAYLTSQWKSGPAGIKSVSISWVNNMGIYRDAALAAGLLFGGAFPYWLEGETNADPSVFPLHEEFLDMVDYYAIMAYSDDAQSVGDFSLNEINYSSDTAKVMVGFELSQQQPPSVTFYEEGFTVLSEAIETVTSRFQNSAGFRGIALHSFDEWAGLLGDMGLRPIRASRTPKALKPVKS